jgi:plasmid stabilization system protein ParE
VRRWVLDRQAEADLQAQLDYLLEQGAIDAAERLSARFLHDFLTLYPGTGIFLDHRGLWETWLPRTRLVVWYRFTDTEVQVARIWHAAQDRQNTPP